MATFALEVREGEKFYHSFLDDLESFFWLIVWCTASHLDPGVTQHSRGALDIMNRLDCDDPLRGSLAKGLFISGYRLGPTTEFLDELNNEWGSSRLLQHAIIEPGVFIDRKLTRQQHRVDLERSPGTTFLTFVKIIKDALALEPEN